MDAPFEVGDEVICVQGTVRTVQTGQKYVITGARWDDEWFVTVEGFPSNLYASRFELAKTSNYTTPVIRKIKQLETRFQQRVAR